MLKIRAGNALVLALEPINLAKLQEEKPIDIDLLDPTVGGPGVTRVILAFASDKASFMEELRKAGLIGPDTKEIHVGPKTRQ